MSSYVQLGLDSSPEVLLARINSQEKVITALTSFCCHAAYYISYFNAVASPRLIKKGADEDALLRARQDVWDEFVKLQNAYYYQIQKGDGN